ncbi:hypothetical protein PIB30_045890 [Stylosanthes scabra]|uniref:Uncharacterized protein n=1 Tax=Stylosanthes scabra TaxID=79078 RepID=A0ABU6TG32_9FABA|nr:hypothetical protein [Stylosanthes scabra]
MARVEDYLADVHPRYHDWNFNVYVVRMWEVPSKSNPKVMSHVELILQDSKVGWSSGRVQDVQHEELHCCGERYEVKDNDKRLVVPLCDKRANEVVGDDTEELGHPTTLDNLIEKRALFKIKIKANNYEKDDKVYTVDYVCEDEVLINKYLPEEAGDQPNPNDAAIGSTNSIDSESIVAIPQDDNVNQSSLDLVETPVSGKRSLKRTSSAKDLVDLCGSDIELDGQHSTNNKGRRGARKSRFTIIDDIDNV